MKHRLTQFLQVLFWQRSANIGSTGWGWACKRACKRARKRACKPNLRNFDIGARADHHGRNMGCLA